MLYESGEKKRWGTDESTFNRVFMTSSDEQLQRKNESNLFMTVLVRCHDDVEPCSIYPSHVPCRCSAATVVSEEYLKISDYTLEHAIEREVRSSASWFTSPGLAIY